jgi:pimeloyl-ACP methyl ester carboxylesterase
MPRYSSFDGTAIAYQDWEPEAGAAPLPPVVLHHGFIADANLNWVGPGVVAALTRAGRRVVALDARGHGASEKPHDPRRYGAGAMATDLIRLFDVIGAPRVDLAGYSMGAVVSLLAAGRDPRVRRLVVGGIGARVVERERGDSPTGSRGAIAAALRAADPASITDPVAVRFRALADRAGGDREALAACADAAQMGGVAFGPITAPTLILVGEQDVLAARPEVLAAAIPGARLLRVPGDHLGAVVDPRFAPAIVAFLAEA